MRKIQWFLIFVAYSSLGVQAFIDLGRGALFPEIIKDLLIGTEKGGLFFSATSFSMLIGSFGASYLLKKFSLFQVLMSFMLSLMAGQYLMFRVQSLTELLLSGCLLGLGFGGMGVCQNLSISRGAPEKYQRKLYGGLHSMYALAAFLGPFSVTQALGAGFSWREIAKFEFMIPVFFFVVYLIGGFFSFKRAKNKEAEVAKAEVSKITFSQKLLSATGLSMYVVGELIVSLWLVIFLQQERGFDTQVSGWAISMFFILLLSGRIIISVFDIPISNYKLLFLSFASSSVLLTLGIVFNAWFIPVSGITMSVAFPIYMSYLAEKLGDSIDQVMPYCIGGMSFIVSLAHSLAGYLGDKFGLLTAMSLSIVGASMALVFIIVMEKSFSQRENA